MIKILGGAVSYTFSVGFGSVCQTIVLFLAIYSFIFLNTLRQIQLTNPIQLLHSENTGEKPPKANWILAILGVLILGCAYYLAVSIENPVNAIFTFFIAVVMVIIRHISVIYLRFGDPLPCFAEE